MQLPRDVLQNKFSKVMQKLQENTFNEVCLK